MENHGGETIVVKVTSAGYEAGNFAVVEIDNDKIEVDVNKN